jgi:hypothetical protein
VATALVAASVASGCAAVAGPTPVIGTATVPGTQDSAQIAGSAPWSPKGAAPVRLISSAGGGETVAVKLGDRIGFPESEPGDVGGYRVAGDGGALIRYGSMTTWLASAPGTVKILITRYDRTRPCVPPQPIGEFTIRVAGDGIRPAIPAPVALPAGGAVTVHLVPGQQLRLAGVNDVVGSTQNVTTNDRTVIRAVRPGTDWYSLWTDRASRTDPDRSLTVVVDDPNTVAGDAGATGPVGLRAAGHTFIAAPVGGTLPARCG